MITYLDVMDFSLLQTYTASQTNQSLVSVLQGKDELGVKRLKINSIADLEQEISSVGDLFSDSSDENLLVDIQDLIINNQSILILQKLSENLNREIWLYSLTQPLLNTESKKMWSKHQLGYELLKSPDESIKKQIASGFEGIVLSPFEKEKLAKQSLTYSELLDNLDFISLCDDQKVAYQSLLKQEETALFMLGFDPERLPSQTPKWYSLVSEDDVQLSLSLIFGKLEKVGSDKSKKIMKLLIDTDQKIKTGSKLNQITRWKLFLFRTLQCL